jgi:DNA polymerase (family 10)
MNNQDVARVFETLAEALQLKGELVYKVQAYRKAANSILNLGRDINQVARAGELESIPGVGPAIAEKLTSLLSTGSFDLWDQVQREIPPGVLAMLHVPDVGPKRARLFWEHGISSVEELADAARAGKLRDLPGMGPASEAKVVAAVELIGRRSERIPLGEALPLAEELLAAVAAAPGVTRAEVGGSLRRRLATIGDIDLLAAAEDAGPVMDAFSAHPRVAAVIARGPTKCTVQLHSGRQVDLRVLPPRQWGTLLQYFSGSQAHNIHLRKLALARGLSLSDQAITEVKSGREIHVAEEEGVYRRLGLAWMPPELREDRGEIEAAAAGKLPELVTLEDLRGDLQMHSTWSDGKASIAEMAEAAVARKLKYILITDHSQSLGVAGGLTPERVTRQRREIAAVNKRLGRRLRVLHGTEVEIRSDATLDYPDELLATLDVVVASLHTGLRQSREQVTRRMLAAIHNPHVDIIAHPTGRLLPDREPADLDMEAVLRAAAETGTLMEINADWHRLDLDDVYVKRAVELGVRLVISSDAHHPDGVGDLAFGVAMARRGWATAEDVMNTRPLSQFLKALNKAPRRA